MKNELLTLTTDIVSAHVGNNAVTASELPILIRSVFDSLQRLGQPVEEETPQFVPAVPIHLSVKHGYLVCLEDGKKLVLLKRYLKRQYGMSPEQYRAKWSLPRDYPMAAPAYAEKRSGIAKATGLGRKRATDSTLPAAIAAKG